MSLAEPATVSNFDVVVVTADLVFHHFYAFCLTILCYPFVLRSAQHEL